MKRDDFAIERAIDIGRARAEAWPERDWVTELMVAQFWGSLALWAICALSLWIWPGAKLPDTLQQLTMFFMGFSSGMLGVKVALWRFRLRAAITGFGLWKFVRYTVLHALAVFFGILALGALSMAWDRWVGQAARAAWSTAAGWLS